MPSADALIRHGQHVMTVCNACRYCEAYCPVFPAMENRRAFAQRDLLYLANLCHNCGECLYACQYAPPHEFGIDVPRTLARIRLVSYEKYSWPRGAGSALVRRGVGTALLLAAACAALLAAVSARVGNLSAANSIADFYQVVPHGAMVAIFGAAGLLVVTALMIGRLRFRRDISADADASRSVQGRDVRGRDSLHALRDALTLRHLHTTGVDCTSGEETRGPWRRRFHHATFYGFLLCFASTTVAAMYHVVLGWRAPYPYTSLPVILGTAGGLGLVVGPAGLFALGRRRDRALVDPDQDGLDAAFITLLWLTSVSGLLLLGMRYFRVMPILLIVHLGFVLALFITLPYGKFVHGIYRATALVKYRREERLQHQALQARRR